MDIYSPKGTKVIYTGKGGYDSDREFANKYLTIGEEYIVEKTDVHNWSTDVYLQELPDKPFNSVHFESKK